MIAEVGYPLSISHVLQQSMRGLNPGKESAMNPIMVGEALVGDGNEISHIDLMIGSKNGPVGYAFANALTNQSNGHTNLLAVLEPNLAVKPSTVMITKVTMKGLHQAVQMFGPAQAAVAKAVADSLGDGEGQIKESEADDLCIVCSVFIHPGAGLDDEGKPLDGEEKKKSDKKIYDYNYDATVLAIKNALLGSPTPKEVREKKDSASHPFKGF